MKDFEDGFRPELPDPLTMADLEFLPDLDDLAREELALLEERLDGLYSALEDEEPDEASEAHAEWEESLVEVADLIDEIESRLEDMDEEG